MTPLSQLRVDAFGILSRLNVPATELAAEALMTPHRDVARMAMNLLVKSGDDSRDLLLEVQRSFENGMEEEATAILAETDEVAAHTTALQARSSQLRRNSI